MAKSRNIYRSIFNAALFIVMEIAALNMLHSSSLGQGFFITRLQHAFAASVWGGIQGIGNYFSLKSVNENLSKENFALRALLGEISASQDSLRSLAVAEGVSKMAGFKYIWAEVNVISQNKQHNYLIVNKGAKDGVRPHSGIITNNGIVGIIDTVGTNYSYAMSFMNSGVNLSARLGREGAIGPLSWDGHSKDGAVLREISLQVKFERGDTVFSSGHSSIFPPDIPLGTVGDARIINGATYEIEVKLLQDFGALRYVTIVQNEDREEITGLEKRGGDR